MIGFTLRFIFTLVLSLGLLGCKKEDPHPENNDPIFKDLEKKAADHLKNFEEAKVKVADLRVQVRKAEAHSIELKTLQKELAKEEARLLGADQGSRYFRIRAERRKLEGRLAYKKAFAEGKEWPDSREYSDYLVNIRLQEANRNWAARVPKLADRLPGSQPAPKKEAAPASGGH